MSTHLLEVACGDPRLVQENPRVESTFQHRLRTLEESPEPTSTAYLSQGLVTWCGLTRGFSGQMSYSSVARASS